MSKVIVTADAAKNVIIPSKNNPEWGVIRVEQTRMVMDDHGFARRKKVSALIAGKIEISKDSAGLQVLKLKEKLLSKNN